MNQYRIDYTYWVGNRLRGEREYIDAANENEAKASISKQVTQKHGKNVEVTFGEVVQIRFSWSAPTRGE